MNARLLSACLVVTMAAGWTPGAVAQSTGKATPRPPRSEGADTSQAASKAPSEDDGSAAEAPFGSPGSTSKDPFDAAEDKLKVAKSKAGGSLDATAPKLERATFGAGCFWHVEAEFEWLPGVKSAVSGYSGGQVANPSYEMVHEGETGHAEVVQVEYDPSVISYEQLLKVFWHGHDPTQWNRQGPDLGTQYRSVIFYHNEDQRKAALKSYRELTAGRVYRGPIVTQLMPMKAFYRAEEYHQNYYGGRNDRPVARSSRSRRTARPAAKKGATATAKPAGEKKSADVAKPVEGERIGSPATPAADGPHAEP